MSHAVALSRSSGLWVAVKMSTTVADGSGSAFVSPDRVRPVMVDIELDGKPYVHQPSMHLYGGSVMGMEHSQIYGRIEAALAYARANDLNRVTVSTERDRIGIISSGKTYYELRQTLRELGIDDDELRRLGVRLLQLRMPYPLDGTVVRSFARGLSEILVLEDKRPFIELFVKDELYALADRPLVLGKLDEQGRPLVPLHAELDTASIARLVAERLGRLDDLPDMQRRLERVTRPTTRPALPLARSPYFCSGCPHNTSVAAVEPGTVVGAGTGCHVLAVFMRPDDVGDILGLTAMGNEGAQWIGASPFCDLDHFIQNIGDGTYAHSGILAIRAAVASGVNITYKLLYNDHVAMTGAQPAIGIRGVPDLCRELLAEGVARVIVTTEDTARYARAPLPRGVDLWDRSRFAEATKTLGAVPGVTVLIHDQECATEKRRRRKRGTLEEPRTRVLINEAVCEGCGDCGAASNCLSVHPVSSELGRKTQIHQPSCNLDYSCLQGNCPSFVTVTTGASGGGSAGSRPNVPELRPEDLPEPELIVPADEFTFRISGIGGTGVVTVAQTLAVAALLEGRFVRGLDQTGLAQKGGPVISDLRITTAPVDQANKLTVADCDLYLACDMLAGAQQANLVVADPERTVSVTSTAQVPTGQMVVDTHVEFPDPAGLLERIASASRPGSSLAVDSPGIAEQLFGSDQTANILLVGAAYQAGALPLDAESIEAAITLNGVQVDTNLQAFRRGRQLLSDEAALAQLLTELRPKTVAPQPTPTESWIASIVRAEHGSELERIVLSRVPMLIAYQDVAYARRYALRVEQVRVAEVSRAGGRTDVAEAVAFSLYKLMAYKDEYEVARLHRDPALKAEVIERFGPDARYRFMLQPPMMKSLGLHKKIAVPDRVGDALFATLAPMKRLRGTRFDPFGRDHVRVVERELLAEFEALVDELAARVGESNHAVALELAQLPDVVRGYDDVKLDNVKTYKEQLTRLRARLTDASRDRVDLPLSKGAP
ncbi:indolepyruvate ferredoxin oxidoreductase family protein [Arsenicicoccus piscis]|uniref:indolepyruvate ferredoxin oxidoreductase family protein n=1 Tax=Arsenicicoccus piscis TaxID=673954 RepID=UPI001F4D2259|nr:indolepyruvate ferredoxin oxidoreductase family protein [Arsenicicoccus piscis]